MDHLICIAATIFLLLITSVAQSQFEENEDKHRDCSKPNHCGKLDIHYPFWAEGIRPNYCGGGEQFRLLCENNEDTWIHFDNRHFLVHNIDPLSYTIIIERIGLIDDIHPCSLDLANNSLDPTLFHYTQNVHNITIFFNCPSNVSINASSFRCLPPKDKEKAFYVDDKDLPQFLPQLNNCKRRIQVQAQSNIAPGYHSQFDDLEQALSGGFEVNYTVPHFQECKQCVDSKGACGSTNQDQFECYRGSPNTLNLWRKIVVGIACAVLSALLMCIIICCFRYKSPTGQVKFCLTTRSDLDLEAFLRNHGALAQKRYKFSEVKKMTNSFNVKLGKGGFGAVYKGKLPTGRLVAVKLLNESKGNGEEFMNEVASISRTSHVNIVTLVGFCLEARKKALIYEFMANGSLDKFIYNKGPETIASLSWENLYQIALGIGRGLEYLHRGCNTRILHFDIKPHNILLDENFCPKISDFGLAKLCPRKESIISMSDARGTLGYVAPEVCNRHFGGVSHKSDVYSYGMMLLEMVGGRKNVNAEASNTSAIYFPHLVFNRLEQDNDIRPDQGMTSHENEIAKRMTKVGLWCIQTVPNDRPTMSRVIDMLEGSMNSLEMPPKPMFSSPTRSVSENL